MEDARTGDSRRARALVYAALPDRLHVEIVSGVGTTQAILDAGAGRVAITVPRERVSYVGRADPRALGALVGLPASPEELVRALLLGETTTLAVVREGAVGSLPQRLRLRTSEGSLELRLRSVEPLRADAAALGTGLAPPGMDPRSIEELWDDPSRVRSESP